MRFIRTFKNFASRLWQQRALIYSMAVRELHFRYAGTFAGILWAIANPLVMVLIYWFVFSYGLRVQPMDEMPFILVFMCGYIPWITFVECLSNSTGSIVSNSHLVKKTIFPTEMLPVVHLLAGLPMHFVLLLALLVAMVISGHMPSLYNLQFLYYYIGLSVFTLGLSWITAALNAFSRDVGQVVGVILNIWFWLTPIVWPLNMIHEKYIYILKFNPIYYVVDGYRASFLSHEVLFKSPIWSIYFWSVTIAFFILGGVVFKRLKIEFPDVL